MIKLFTDEEFKACKSREKSLKLQCVQCSETFLRTKHYVQQALNPNHKTTGMFCSTKCTGDYNNRHVDVICAQCGKPFQKMRKEMNSENHFCSQSCNATYQNLHNNLGIRVSKLEVYLASMLPDIFPELTFRFNDTEIIGSELDIYIEELELAIEINGIWHYQVVKGGQKVLDRIQANDKIKLDACIEKNIIMVSVNTSEQNHFTVESSQPYLNYIVGMIFNVMGEGWGTEALPVDSYSTVPA